MPHTAFHDANRDIEALLAPAPTPDLAAVLEQLETFLRRYVVFSRPEERIAVVLWVAHTHAVEAAEATPYLAITSPEKQSGKTRLLECLRHVAHATTGILIAPTAATIYRSLDAVPGTTLLLDELDAIFRDRSDRYEEVRAVINAGHRRGATVPRSVPGPRHTWTVKPFEVFGPKALAGIGSLPETVQDRSIPIRMLKRKRTEPVERFRERVVRAEAAPIVKALQEALAATPPSPVAEIPEALPDRAGDGWEPLLAVAEAAGGSWIARARTAAMILHADAEEDDSLGLRLLADVRRVFEERDKSRIASATLLEALRADDESPWADERSGLTPHRLAKLLRRFGIRSRQMRIGEENVKGFERAWFLDLWERYLPDAPTPRDPKLRNAERASRFDVAIQPPTDGGRDLPVADDYPRSAWDVDPPVGRQAPAR